MRGAETKTIKTVPQPAKATLSRNQGPVVERAQANLPSLRTLRVEAEIDGISRTLEYTGWNRRRAAQVLCISYRGILRKIRQHNLSPPPQREGAAGGRNSQDRFAGISRPARTVRGCVARLP